MNELPAFILASASPRRKELLQEIGLPFDVMPGDAEELHSEHLTISELCQINAYRKARQISKKRPDAIVLGADTLVALGSRAFGKPRSLGEAEDMLAKLQGRTHEVVTGVCLIHLRAHQQRTFAEMTLVKFRKLSRAEICAYLNKINPLDKAGGYALQEHGNDIIENVQGSESNVIGLPLERLRGELTHLTPDPLPA